MMRAAPVRPTVPLAANASIHLPTSSSVPVGMRPPTGSGLLPVGMRPPTGSGAASGRPQSGAFRPPTGSQRDPVTGAAMNALPMAVSVVARPVTAAGLAGQATHGASAGSQRQIADKNYYISELRARMTAITAESNRLEAEEAAIARDNSLYTSLERRYEQVMGEVRVLEGELADYNLALDKLRTHTSAEEMAAVLARLKDRNDADREEVDQIFIESGAIEAECNDIEREMQSIEMEASAALRVLGEEKVLEFQSLSDDARQWKSRRQQAEETLLHTQTRIQQLKHEFSSAQFKRQQEAVRLHRDIATLSTRVSSLDSDVDLSADPATYKEKLTARIKSETETLRVLEQRGSELDAMIESAHVAIAEAEESKQDHVEYQQKASKYEAIYERDAKMTHFIEGSDEMMRDVEQQNTELEGSIVLALETISAESARTSSLSSASSGDLAEVQSAVSFKSEKQKSNVETLAVLEREKAKRADELKKIEQLDAKIADELVALSAEMKVMEADKRAFQSEAEWKQFHADEKKRLTVKLAHLKRERELARSNNAVIHEKLARAQKELESVSGAAQCRDLELSVQDLQARVFELSEECQQRHRETNYATEKQECLQLIAQINQANRAKWQHRPTQRTVPVSA